MRRRGEFVGGGALGHGRVTVLGEFKSLKTQRKGTMCSVGMNYTKEQRATGGGFGPALLSRTKEEVEEGKKGGGGLLGIIFAKGMVV